MKASGKPCPFYSPCKGRLKNLGQSFLHVFGSHSPSRRTFSPSFVRTLLFIGVGFTGRSFWRIPVTVLFFIVGRGVRIWRDMISLSSTKLLFQIIYFMLQVLFISMLLHQMALSSIATFPHMDRPWTAFSLIIHVVFPFEIREFVWLTDIYWFCMKRTGLLWSWTSHNCRKFLLALILPTDGANCRVTNCSLHLDGNRRWAQQAQNNKFVREWVKELG